MSHANASIRGASRSMSAACSTAPRRSPSPSTWTGRPCQHVAGAGQPRRALAEQRLERRHRRPRSRSTPSDGSGLAGQQPQRGDGRPGRQRRDPRALGTLADERQHGVGLRGQRRCSVPRSARARFDWWRCRAAAATVSAVRPELEIDDRERVGARWRAARRRRDLRDRVAADGPERGRGIAGGEPGRAHADEHPPRSVEEPVGERGDPAPVQVDRHRQLVRAPRGCRPPGRRRASVSPVIVRFPPHGPAASASRRAAPTAMMAAPWRRTRIRNTPSRPRTRRADRGRR